MRDWLQSDAKSEEGIDAVVSFTDDKTGEVMKMTKASSLAYLKLFIISIPLIEDRKGQSFFSWDWPCHAIGFRCRPSVSTWTPSNASGGPSRRRRLKNRLLSPPSGPGSVTLPGNPVKARPLRVSWLYPSGSESKNNLPDRRCFHWIKKDLPVRLDMHLAGCNKPNQTEILYHGLYTNRRRWATDTYKIYWFFDNSPLPVWLCERVDNHRPVCFRQDGHPILQYAPGW